MIEVLLAVVILAIGLMAGSKMQMLGMNYTQGAQFRTNATMAANDIIDRMRVNPDAVANGDYDGATPTIPRATRAALVWVVHRRNSLQTIFVSGQGISVKSMVQTPPHRCAEREVRST